MIDAPWADDKIPTTPVGFRTSTLEGVQEWTFRSAILLRRVLFRPWFRLIARIGEKGIIDEYFLDPVKVRGNTPVPFGIRLGLSAVGSCSST